MDCPSGGTGDRRDVTFQSLQTDLHVQRTCIVYTGHSERMCLPSSADWKWENCNSTIWRPRSHLHLKQVFITVFILCPARGIHHRCWIRTNTWLMSGCHQSRCSGKISWVVRCLVGSKMEYLKMSSTFACPIRLTITTFFLQVLI